MTDRLRHRLFLPTTALGLSVLMATTLWAQTPAQNPAPAVYPPVVISDAARWYQVNVLIFSQNTVIERNPETWPSYPILDRTVPPINLITPRLPDEADPTLDSVGNSDAVPVLDALGQPVTQAGLPLAEDDLAAIDTPFYGLDETFEASDPQFADTPATAAPPAGPLLTLETAAGPLTVQPYETLPHTERYLTPYADKLERDRRYKILFHESWIQPIESANLARPVYVTGGYQSGLLSELSGLINITISRYLHVNTQLYLTDIVESSDPFDLLTGQKYAFVPLSFENTQSETSPDTTQALAADPLEPFSLKGITAESGFGAADEPDYFDIPATYAVAVSSVLMAEKRRLRSKELHYIDNPKMGLLIYFTPFDIDAASAEAERLDDEGTLFPEGDDPEATPLDVLP